MDSGSRNTYRMYLWVLPIVALRGNYDDALLLPQLEGYLPPLLRMHEQDTRLPLRQSHDKVYLGFLAEQRVPTSRSINSYHRVIFK